jgi:Fic family protein
LSKLLSENLIVKQGNAKSTKYLLSPAYRLFQPIDLENYYNKEIDEKNILTGYDFELIPNTLQKYSLFTNIENEFLNSLQAKFIKNISELSDSEYHKDMECLAIDLCWKSSQIEGNTYSLPETESLLKEKKTAAGKTEEETIILLNHKDAIDFIVKDAAYFKNINIAKIKELNNILIKELTAETNIRHRRLGTAGTNYRPFDNEFQVNEAMQQVCDLINQRDNVFEKALFALVLLSYIQAFTDGNKCVAHLMCNALMLAHKHCPVSFRTVNSVDYKKAMFLFYEQNNISAFKQIFINQFQFAVENYF